MSYGSNAGEMVVGLRLDAEDFNNGLRTAAANMQAFNGNVTGMLYGLSRLGMSAAPIAALTIGLGQGAKAASELQQQVANLNAVLAATPQQMQKITATSLELSRQTQFTTAQIIQAQTQLAKAGSSPAGLQSQTGNVLNLASSTFSTPTQAATLYIAAQKDFQRTTSDSTDTVNILGKAIDSSTLSTAQWQQAFKQIGPVANANKISLKDTATAIADLSQAGLQGDVGTALKTFLQRITTETPQARKAIQDLNLQFFDGAGQLKPYADILDEIRVKTAGLPTEQVQQQLGTIFGQRGIRVADIASQEGSQGFLDAQQHMDQLGTTAEIARAKLNTLSGDAHILASSLNVLAVEGGNGVLPMLTRLTQNATGAANALSGLNPLATQLFLGVGATAGVARLGSALGGRGSSAPGGAPGLSAGQVAFNQQASQYQTELGAYQTYQTQLAGYQAQEIARQDAHDQKLQALELEHQTKLAAIRQANISTPIAGREAALAQEALYAKQVAANPYVAGKAPPIVTAPVPITMPISTVELPPDAPSALQAKATRALAGAKATIGSLIMPVTIALLADQLIVKPIEQSLIDKAVANDPQLRQLTLHTQMVLDPNNEGNPEQNAQALKDAADKQVTLYQSQVDKVQSFIQSHPSTAMQSNVPILGSALNGLDVLIGVPTADDLKVAQAKLDQAKGLQKQAQDALNSDSPQAKKTALATAQADIADQTAQIVSDYAAGRKSYEDAKNEMTRAAIASLPGGDNFQQTLTDQIAKGTQQLNGARDQAKATADAADQQWLDSRDAAHKAAVMGASGETISEAIFGTTIAGGDASASQIRQAKKDIADLTTAWNEANTAVNRVDITKGLSAFAGSATDLEKAVNALAKVGQTNSNLSALAATAQGFKDIADDEDRASASLNGYLLTLDQTDARISKVDALKKAYLDAVNAAEQRQLAGTASGTDMQLIAGRTDTIAQFDKTISGLQQNSSQDWLGIGKSLPDLVTADDKMREMVNMAGGGKELYLQVKAETDAAQTAIDNIVNHPYEVTVNVNFSRQYSLSDVVGFPVPGSGIVSASGGGTPPGVPPSSSGGGGGSLAYHQLTTDQVASIIENGGGRGGAMDNTPAEQALLDAARAANVDPLAMLATLQFEGNYGAKTSKQNIAANNLGGIKFDNQPGASRGSTSPEGDSYAAFDSQNSFYANLARNLSTGGYASAYQQGNFGAIRQQYITGGGTPSDAQMANINNSVDLYNRLKRQYEPDSAPTLSGYSGQTPLGYGQGGDVMGGGDIANTIRNQIVAKAFSQVGQDKLVDYCEQFVEETVQAITGKRGATGIKEPTASAAFAHGQAMGLETHDPQPGDLVYYPGAAGGTGHVAIYVGGGQQVSTWDNGPQTGVNRQIHQEPIGQGARFLSTTAGGYQYGVGDPGNRGNNTGGTALLNDPAYLYNKNTLSGSSGSGSSSATALPDLTNAITNLVKQFPALSAAQVGSLFKQYGQVEPTMVKMEGISRFGPNGPTGAGDQAIANRAGAADTLNIVTLTAKAMDDFDHNSKNVAADLAQIANTAGPLGTMFAAQAVASSEIAAATAKQKQDQQDLTTLDQAHNDALKQRSTADKRTQLDRKATATQEQQAASDKQRRETRDDWKVQDDQQKAAHKHQVAMDNFAAETDAENDSYTTTSRRQEDAKRNLQEQGAIAQRQLEDQQTAMERAHRDSLGLTSANNQLLMAQSKAALSSGGANTPGIQLAIAQDNAKLLNTDYQKQQDRMADAIKQQQRFASDAAFNLDAETIAAQRVHEDKLKQISDEQKAENLTYQTQTYNDQVKATGITRTRTLEQWAEQDRQRGEQLTYDAIDQYILNQRDQEDKAYEDRKTQLTADQQQQADFITKWGTINTALSDAETTWEKLVPLIGKAADPLLNVANDVLRMAGYGGTASPPPGNALGTDYWVGGRTSLGEHGVEAVLAPGSKVLSNASIRSLVNALSSPQPMAAGGGGNTFNFNIQGGSSPDAQAQEEIKAYIMQKIKESEQRARSGGATRAAGGMR